MILEKIPPELKRLRQWALWRSIERDGARTKIPFGLDGRPAKSDAPETWAAFPSVLHQAGGYDGIALAFAKGGNIVGVDLDGCRDPETGEVAAWAREVIERLDSYSEVSPSGSGVHIIVRGDYPFPNGRGKNRRIDAPPAGGKNAGIEMYAERRFFCITGQRLSGVSVNVEERTGELAWLAGKYFPERTNGKSVVENLPQLIDADANVLERARAYLAEVPPAISGQGGHNQTFRAACVLVLGFDLSEADAFCLLSEWNRGCQPPWSDGELLKKIRDAANEPGERGHLRDRPAPTPENLPDLDRDESEAAGLDDEPDFGLPGERPDVQPEARKIDFGIISSGEFDELEFETEWLINGVLVAREPGIISGRKKTLKTNVMLDLAISLARGGCFLGRFPVNRACKVLVMSAESGRATLQETARRICRAAGTDLGQLSGGLHWAFKTPKLAVDDHLAALREAIADYEIEVLFIDPLYLSIPGADAANLFIMGEMLRGVAEVCQETGVTLLFVHHNKEGMAHYEPPELDSMAWAGVQEFAGQWVLLERSEKYTPGTGVHNLFMSIGGSAGHSSLWGVEIDEGVRTEETERHWRVTVTRGDEARDELRQKAQEARQAEREARNRAQIEGVKEAIRKAFNSVPGNADTKTAIQNRAGHKRGLFDEAMGELLRTGEVIECEITKGNSRTYPGFKRVFQS